MARRKKKSNIPIILTIGGGVLLIITALMLVSRSEPPEQASSAPLTSDSHEEETFPEIPRVSLENSKAAFDAETATFLDVRDADSFAASHIPGSLNIPLAELPSRLSEMDKNQWIITYCT
jgi:3-mercaptopyruvate sulfurtransferase SseA